MSSVRRRRKRIARRSILKYRRKKNPPTLQQFISRYNLKARFAKFGKIKYCVMVIKFKRRNSFINLSRRVKKIHKVTGRRVKIKSRKVKPQHLVLYAASAGFTRFRGRAKAVL